MGREPACSARRVGQQVTSLLDEYTASVQEAVSLGYDKDQLRTYLRELNRWLRGACADVRTYYKVLTDAQEILANLYTQEEK